MPARRQAALSGTSRTGIARHRAGLRSVAARSRRPPPSPAWPIARAASLGSAACAVMPAIAQSIRQQTANMESQASRRTTRVAWSIPGREQPAAAGVARFGGTGPGHPFRPTERSVCSQAHGRSSPLNLAPGDASPRSRPASAFGGHRLKGRSEADVAGHKVIRPAAASADTAPAAHKVERRPVRHHHGGHACRHQTGGTGADRQRRPRLCNAEPVADALDGRPQAALRDTAHAPRGRPDPCRIARPLAPARRRHRQAREQQDFRGVCRRPERPSAIRRRMPFGRKRDGGFSRRFRERTALRIVGKPRQRVSARGRSIVPRPVRKTAVARLRAATSAARSRAARDAGDGVPGFVADTSPARAGQAQAPSRSARTAHADRGRRGASRQ